MKLDYSSPKILYQLDGKTLSKDISNTEFDTLYNSLEVLNEYNKICYLAQNYLYAEKQFTLNKNLKSMHDIYECLGFLTSIIAIIRMNIDAWNTFLHSNYKDDKRIFSDDKSIFEKECNSCYDKNDGYAIVYNLRNQVLHSANMISKIASDDNTIKVYIKPEDFIFGINDSFKNILKKYEGKYIDIVKAISDTFECLHTLNNFIFCKIFEINKEKYKNAYLCLKNLNVCNLISPALIWVNNNFENTSIRKVDIEYIHLDIIKSLENTLM